MKALDRYVKKNKTEPFGKSKTKGSWKGSEGPQKEDQYASDTGKKIFEDSMSMDESDPATSSAGTKSIKSGGTKKKQRAYLD